MAEHLNIALIGCGGMMGGHVNAYRELAAHDFDNFTIVACCDVREDAAKAYAERIGEFQKSKPAVYTSVEDLLDKQDDLQAVDISVLHREHHVVASMCAEAGKHITIEKPFAITMRAGKIMLDAAAAAGVKLHVAENYRRALSERANRWAIKSGRIGEPWMIYWIDAGLRQWYWTWREHRMDAGAGWTLDGGVHFADMFRYHLGPVEEAYAVTRAFWPHRYENSDPLGGKLFDVDVEDAMIAILKFEGAPTVGQWTLTSACHGGGFGKRAVYGSEGCLDWGAGLKADETEMDRQALEAAFMASLSEEDKELYFPRGIMDTVAQELKEFIDAVLYGKPMETDGLEGYKAEAICYAVYESAVTGQPVKTADVEALKIEEYQKDINEHLGIG
jgi:predicted dehydrogenase